MKHFIWFLFGLLLLTACEKEPVLPAVSDANLTVEERGEKNKISVCHNPDNNAHIINISANAWPAHAAHGDVLLTDADGDGYVTETNECVPGGDCDDNNAAVNPAAEEVCDDRIDNDCDGAVDEGCFSYPTLGLAGKIWLARNLDIDIPGSSWCPGNSADYCASEGRLYTWQAAQDACAQLGDGWRLASDEDWSALVNASGGPEYAYHFLRRGGSNGFNATLSGKYFSETGTFGNYGYGEMGEYWTSTVATEGGQAVSYLFHRYGWDEDQTSVDKNYSLMEDGLSCRCVKDYPVPEEVCGDYVDNDGDGEADEGCPYPTFLLGGKTWLAKNLNIDIPGSSWFPDNSAPYSVWEGRLYTWQAAQEACALLGDGWRLPSYEDWSALVATSGWESQFKYTLSGYYYSHGATFSDYGRAGFYWTSTEHPEEEVYVYSFLLHREPYEYIDKYFSYDFIYKTDGISCRCVKD